MWIRQVFFSRSWSSNSWELNMLLLLLSHFSRVRLCATPQTAAHQAPPSLGFSRQEHWSGLPFPSPMHESEKWKWSRSVVCRSLFVTPWTAAYQAPPSMGFSRQEYWSGVPLPSPELNRSKCNKQQTKSSEKKQIHSQQLNGLKICHLGIKIIFGGNQETYWRTVCPSLSA